MTFDQYLAELHTLSKTCDFGDLRDSLVRDRIVCGIPDNGLRERLLCEPALTLEKAVNMCRAAEITRAQAKEVHRDDDAVHAVKREEQHTKQQHIPRSCPAYGKICNSCGKNNHFAKCCKADVAKKKVHTVEEQPEEFLLILFKQTWQTKLNGLYHWL